jgi:curved DNA-binding protein CbpA
MKPETRDVLAYLDKVEPVLTRLTFYELLDVQPDAQDFEIQSAYHKMAGRMHPDRHKAELNAEQYERLNIVYGRITEAYRVLRNRTERDKYGREIARHGTDNIGGDDKTAAKLLSPKAQRLYRRAQAALRTGDRASALLNLKMALRDSPNSAMLKQALADAKKQ